MALKWLSLFQVPHFTQARSRQGEVGRVEPGSSSQTHYTLLSRSKNFSRSFLAGFPYISLARLCHVAIPLVLQFQKLTRPHLCGWGRDVVPWAYCCLGHNEAKLVTSWSRRRRCENVCWVGNSMYPPLGIAYISNMRRYFFLLCQRKFYLFFIFLWSSDVKFGQMYTNWQKL